MLTVLPALACSTLFPVDIMLLIIIIILLFYLFIFYREGNGERERGAETLMGCLSYAPSWGPGPQPKHVPRLGIELTTFQFTGCCSIHYATPAGVCY